MYHKQREIYSEIHNSEKVRPPKTKERFEKKSEREKVSLFFFFKVIIYQLISRYHGKLKGTGIFWIWGKYLPTWDFIIYRKVKFTKIEGVSHTWPSSDKTILHMLQMEVNDVRDKVYTAERNEEVEAAHLWSPKAGIRAKAETCGKGLCKMVASIVSKCSLDCIFYKKT